MPASEITTFPVETLKVESKGNQGRNLRIEVHEVTFASDKTCEVLTYLKQVVSMSFCEVNAAVGSTAHHLGTDFIITPGATTDDPGSLTVSTIASNSLKFKVTLIGY